MFGDFGVSGPVIVGSTNDWPVPFSGFAQTAVATLLTAGSSTTTAVIKQNGGATPIVTVTYTSGVSGLLVFPIDERVALDDLLRMEVTGAGAGAIGLHIQVRGR